jgi:uncharacterized iron-regulated membrane protein
MAAWRWHFFAGIVVIPFLLVLATTGLVMLYSTAVQTQVGEQLTVAAAPAARTSPLQQLAAAQQALPDATAATYIPASSPDRPVQFELKRNDQIFAVDIDPYTTAVLRVVDKDNTLYALAHRIHGTLLLGEIGDTVLEVVAVLLCFFLLSGLAWTNVWGGKLVQPWNSFPAERWGPLPLAGNAHGAMNHGAHKAVPWGLEQTPLPASTEASRLDGDAAINLDAIDQMARELGFGPRYRINLPQDADGVYTISSTSMSGEVDRPGDERTVHIDRYSGEIVAEVRFADYPALAKSMAVGVAVHQGSLGWWSIALDVLACITVVLLCISGTLMWWLRRPARAGWLPVPPRVSNLPLRSGFTVLLLAMGIAFPLLGAALLAALLAYALVSRMAQQNG